MDEEWNKSPGHSYKYKVILRLYSNQYWWTFSLKRGHNQGQHFKNRLHTLQYRLFISWWKWHKRWEDGRAGEQFTGVYILCNKILTHRNLTGEILNLRNVCIFIEHVYCLLWNRTGYILQIFRNKKLHEVLPNFIYNQYSNSSTTRVLIRPCKWS